MQLPTTSKQNPAPGVSPRRFLWDALLSLLLLGSVLPMLSAPWGTLAPSWLWPGLAAAAGWGLCALGDAIKPRRFFWLPSLLPWPFLLGFAGSQALKGLLLWINCILSIWNQLHEGGLVLFSVQATAASVLALCVLSAFALGQLTWYLITRRQRLLEGFLGGACLLLQLLTASLLPWAWVGFTGAFLGLWITRAPSRTPPRQALRLWGCAMAALCLITALTVPGELPSVTQLRQRTAEAIHTLRYGQDTLPQGDLRQAQRLNQDTAELMEVQTEQEKNLYLRAFVGADYDSGVWTPLPDSAYAGDYAGMLDWLQTQDFNPMTQPAAYWSLSDGDSVPEENSLRIHVTNGSRYYLYTPSTLDTLSTVPWRAQKDLRLKPRDFLGANLYTATERSSALPSELTVQADWISSPETEAQRRYVQAEGVYREFVYSHYATADEALEPVLQSLFWQEYQPENDSIYSALDRIRSVLRKQTSYTRTPDASPTDTDPIRSFLTGSRQGNAMLYASAAVEALRSHGIPARYVEGYYLSASAAAASADGTVSLTGQDAHAWAEIYFDGMGWLPVDVTPGYYYDAISLQQMVALPDTIRKTAALDDDTSGGEDAVPSPSGTTRPRPQISALIRNTGLLLLGLAAFAALAATILFLLLELLWQWTLYRAQRDYRRASPQEKARRMQQLIFALLSLLEIDACLGWHTEETDRMLVQRFPEELQPGDYRRAAHLMEKFTYGGAEPLPYELRTLYTLVEKLSGVSRQSHRQLIRRQFFSRRLHGKRLLSPPKKSIKAT